MSSLERVSGSNDVVNSYFSRLLTPSLGGRIPSTQVAERKGETGPYAEFGRWLKDQRLAAGLRSQPQAVLAAVGKELHLINQGKLSHLERGFNSDPEPDLLRQLAVLYRLEYRAIVAKWLETKFGLVAKSDLLRHIGTGPSAPHNEEEEETDVPASARIRELEDRVKAYEVIVRHVRELATEITTTTGEEGSAITRGHARRSSRHRKTG